MCVTFVLALASNQKKSLVQEKNLRSQMMIPLASLHRLMELCILDLRHYA